MKSTKSLYMSCSFVFALATLGCKQRAMAQDASDAKSDSQEKPMTNSSGAKNLECTVSPMQQKGKTTKSKLDESHLPKIASVLVKIPDQSSKTNSSIKILFNNDKTQPELNFDGVAMDLYDRTGNLAMISAGQYTQDYKPLFTVRIMLDTETKNGAGLGEFISFDEQANPTEGKAGIFCKPSSK